MPWLIPAITRARVNLHGLPHCNAATTSLDEISTSTDDKGNDGLSSLGKLTHVAMIENPQQARRAMHAAAEQLMMIRHEIARCLPVGLDATDDERLGAALDLAITVTGHQAAALLAAADAATTDATEHDTRAENPLAANDPLTPEPYVDRHSNDHRSCQAIPR